MKVKRVVEMKVNSFEIGDQIKVKVKGLGSFSATAHRITEQGTLFIFNNPVVRRVMNKEMTNEGGFMASDLHQWMNETLVMLFPKKLKVRMRPVNDAGDLLKLPTYGQMFGHDDDDYEYIEPDNDDQLLLMQNEKNRICVCGEHVCQYWLENAFKREASSTDFCIVGDDGNMHYEYAFSSAEVLPVFLIGKQI